jgi:hypothetical protein
VAGNCDCNSNGFLEEYLRWLASFQTIKPRGETYAQGDCDCGGGFDGWNVVRIGQG